MHDAVIQTADGQQIAVLCDNQDAPGPPIVFIHGILGSIRFWPPIMPSQIRHAARWFSMSLPGHHPARFPTGHRAVDFTPQRLAETYEEVFQSLFGNEPIAIVGYSTGGFAALNHAIHYPRRVESILSIAGFADGRWSGPLGLLQRLARRGAIGRFFFRKFLSVISSRLWLFERLHHTVSCRSNSRRNAVVRDTLRSVFQDASAHRAGDLTKMFDRLRGISILPELKNVAAPTVIAAGDRDSVIPLEHSQEIAAEMPHAKLVTFDRCNHLFFADCLPEYQQLLVDWVDGIQRLKAPRRAA